MATTVSDILTSARYDLKDPGGDNWSNAELIDYINRMLDVIIKTLALYEIDLGWKLGTSISLTSGTDTYTLATDFIAPYRLILSDKTTPMEKINIDEYLEYESDEKGTPENYMIQGNTLYVKPIPDKTKTLKPYYYYDQSVSATTDTIPFNGIFDEVIRQGVVIIALNRDEYNPNLELQLLGLAEAKALAIGMKRGKVFKIIPKPYPKE